MAVNVKLENSSRTITESNGSVLRGGSFVTDVLKKTGSLEKEDLQKSVIKLSQKVDCVKVLNF